jgi:hypothetical protein
MNRTRERWYSSPVRIALEMEFEFPGGAKIDSDRFIWPGDALSIG